VAPLNDHPAVERVRAALVAAKHPAEIVELSETARTAADAAAALGIEVGQVASSIVFGLPGDPDPRPLLVITSGRHRVDTQLVAEFAIGGVSPVGWITSAQHHLTELGYPSDLTILIDLALNDYEILWAAAGHTHAVFQTSFAQLIEITGAIPAVVGA
jgi:prolyl-tRNA editing enzyme YbaK/EbsC (Cys-tRNA(Pro) deacylase)